MKKRKSVLAITVAAMLCVSLSVTSYAESGKSAGDISIMNIVRENCISDLSISGSSATCTSRITGDSVKSITAIQTLQRKSGSSWISVSGANWTKTTSISMLYMSNCKTGLSAGIYRLKTVIRHTNTSGQTETITVYSTEQTVK